MSEIYIEAVISDDNLASVNLETLLVIHVYHVCDSGSTKLNVVCKENLEQPLFSLDLSTVSYECIEANRIPDIARLCVWPVVTVGNTVIAGLCSVTRQIVKDSGDNELRNLLGFKEGCLLACSESSVWTRFCEVEVPSAVKSVLLNFDEYVRDDVIYLPAELTKFEYHMRQPVRMHNIYKAARQKHNDRTIKSSVPLEKLNLPHVYGEGSSMTLADVLLYPCFEILFRVFGSKAVKTELPLCVTWLENMRCSNLRIIKFELPLISTSTEENFEVVQESVVKESLYASDPNKDKPQNRIYTKQIDIDNSIDIVGRLDFEVSNGFEPFGSDIEFDWSAVPVLASPLGGALPKKRANRKCEQLENLSRAVMKLVGERARVIVDFCSGSGHLGILLATLLPSCKVILVENKERSLLRASERILQLGLENITMLQCNLDYFSAKFDVGVSLHACGVATDMVIQNCIKSKAHFVCCPCCYGSIHDCYHLKYPRSKEYSESDMNYKDYLIMAHAADQTHDSDNVKTKQGYICMDIIDTDRKLHAESCGYVVHLGKLQPTSCTPKNNLLVGVHNIY